MATKCFFKNQYRPSTIFLTAFGLVLYSFGTALFYCAELGSSSYATMCEGLSRLTNTTVGNISVLISILACLLLFFADKSKIGFGTLFSVLSGTLVDPFYNFIIRYSTAYASTFGKLCLLIVGIILTSIGFGLYMAMNTGVSSIDGLMQFFSTKSGIELKYSQMIEDTLFIIFGITTGASYGIGTLLAMIFTGPIMQYVFDKVCRSSIVTNN